MDRLRYATGINLITFALAFEWWAHVPAALVLWVSFSTALYGFVLLDVHIPIVRAITGRKLDYEEWKKRVDPHE